jgi:hypothetical protein
VTSARPWLILRLSKRGTTGIFGVAVLVLLFLLGFFSTLHSLVHSLYDETNKGKANEARNYIEKYNASYF